MFAKLNLRFSEFDSRIAEVAAAAGSQPLPASPSGEVDTNLLMQHISKLTVKID
jgi:hypothetical protein